MLFVKSKIKKNKFGKGLYSNESINKKTIVAIFPVDSKLTTEDFYSKEQMNNNESMIQTGVRYIGTHFLFGYGNN